MGEFWDKVLARLCRELGENDSIKELAEKKREYQAVGSLI